MLHSAFEKRWWPIQPPGRDDREYRGRDSGFLSKNVGQAEEDMMTRIEARGQEQC